MPLARVGICTVFQVKELLTSLNVSDHIARPSSPEFRTWVCVTVELLVPRAKLTASAQTVRIRQFVTCALFVWLVVHTATFPCSNQTLETVELVRTPSTPETP